MRQASWNEMFGFRHEALVVAPNVPEEPRGWRRLLWWEDLVTFALLVFVFFTVVTSVDRAHWADDMPTLASIALCGLVVGALMAKLPWPEGFVHLLALPLGAAAALGQILLVVPGPNPVQRFEALTTRMGDWFAIAFGSGISNDELPFIVLVVPMAWLAAYLSAWAVFRWRNAWLALAPGGTALLLNISLMTGQFSVAFVFFLLGGTLLVTRLHLLDRAKRWRDDGTAYPTYLSLSVLHATFWVAIALLGIAWLMPRADEAGAVESIWRRSTAPATDRIDGLARLFVGVNPPGNGSGRVHDYEDILPFLGSIELPDTLVAEVTASGLGQPRYLRSQTFDVYTQSGWRLRSQLRAIQPANEGTQVDDLLSRRLPFVIEFKATDDVGDEVLSVGQPLTFDRGVVLRWLTARENVTGIVSPSSISRGESYQATGSISIATEEQLRAAGMDYPSWVMALYLQLPQDLPLRLQDLAGELAGSELTPYDKAVAIETYLREIPYDLDVPDTPPGRDAIDFFLFDAKRGYFDYHASAMVVLLRAASVPSRLAIGYALEQSQRAAGSNSYLVTEKNAFAWPEVYFPGLGWVEFNPTPSLPPVQRPFSLAGDGAFPGDGGGPNGDLGFGNLPGEFPSDGGSGATDISSGGSGGPWLLIGLGAGLAALVLSLAGGVSVAWLRGLRGLSPAARLWEQTVRLASWARVPPEPGQTPYEYAETLRAQVPNVAGVDVLAGAYVRQQFGREQLDENERSLLEEAWRAVRGRLLKRLFRLP